MEQHTLIDLLKSHALKATFQRIAILEAIERYGHMDVDEIYEAVRLNHATLSLATVYKNIIKMVESGVLVEVPVTGRKSKYEIKKRPHAHLICRECGGVVDTKLDAHLIEDTQRIARDHAFVLEEQQVSLYGVCSACAEAKAS
jgi:Fur family ferric uptake transcriptional regulator/Fur family peroxide stress response transcriptional regulator